MEKIIRGIHQFQASVFSEQKELFERLSAGQSPEALFITCSDSRINPNLMTQTEPGELFILRNAGNIVPPYGAANGGEGATIEFAVKGLGIRDIIVCGHTHCGAMKGLLDESAVRTLPAVKDWLRHAAATASIVQEKYPDQSGEELLNTTVKENVLVQIDNLRTHPCVAAGLSSGTINLHAWVYRFETGDVFAFNPRESKFLAIGQVPADSLGETKLAAI